MESRASLPDFKMLFALEKLADEYASEIARGPLTPRWQESMPGSLNVFDHYSIGHWHPSPLLTDDADLLRGPEGAFGGGLLAPTRDDALIARFAARHQSALIERFACALAADPAYGALFSVPEFQALLDAFNGAQIAARLRSPLRLPDARARLIAILAGSLSHYRMRVLAPKVRISPTKETRDEAIYRIKQWRKLWRDGLRSIDGALEAERTLEQLLVELEKPSNLVRQRAPRADASAPAREALSRAKERMLMQFGSAPADVMRHFAALLGYRNTSSAASR